MSDIDIVYDNDVQFGDIVIENDDAVSNNGLEPSVLISLFTDRRAEPSDLDDPTKDPRGWWADAVSGVQQGSRLWLLERSKVNQRTVNLAQQYAIEALQWMIDDGVASNMEIEAIILNGTQLCISVRIFKDGTTLFEQRYDDLWNSQFGLDS